MTSACKNLLFAARKGLKSCKNGLPNPLQRFYGNYAAAAPDMLNPKLVNMEYAVRGKPVLMAEDFAKRLNAGEKLPFDDLVFCNIGNPQSVGQKPVTFFRQVLALCMCPSLLENASIISSIPSDVISRAKLITTTPYNYISLGT